MIHRLWVFAQAWFATKLLDVAVSLCDAGLWLNRRDVIGPGTVLGMLADAMVTKSESISQELALREMRRAALELRPR